MAATNGSRWWPMVAVIVTIAGIVVSGAMGYGALAADVARNKEIAAKAEVERDRNRDGADQCRLSLVGIQATLKMVQKDLDEIKRLLRAERRRAK